MKNFIVIVVLLIVVNHAFSQTPAKKENIRTVLELTGSGKLGIQIMQNMTAEYKKSLPTVPQEFWDEMAKEANVDSLIDLVTPVYAKYFSDAEILELIAFYKTPLGQKLLSTEPKAIQLSMSYMNQWAQAFGGEVNTQMRAEMRKRGKPM